MKRLSILLALMLSFVMSAVSAQEARPYSEGPVTVVTSVAVMEGQFDNYMAFLAKNFKPLMDAQQKSGDVVSWYILDASPRRSDDPDVYLVVTYPNMAAFDGMADRSAAVRRETTGVSREQWNQGSAARGNMRKILGTEMMRAIILK